MDVKITTKEIKGFERYVIDINGLIYDTKRNKPVCQWVDTVGYYQCNLRDSDGKKHYKRVHRLVAKTFIPNPNNLPQVNHKDGNKLNNNMNNLIKAIKISKFTKKILVQNIVFALTVKFVALIIGMLGILGSYGMLLGVFADVGVCLITILNTLRILKYGGKNG